MVPSLDLVHRVVEADAAYTLARMQVLHRIPGNPFGVAWQRFENITALLVPRLPSPSFNRVLGLRSGQADQIAPLVDWYREHAVPARFEIAAGDDEPALGRELARLGFYQSGFHAALIRDPDTDITAPAGIAIERVATPEGMERFLAAYVAGWGVDAGWREQFKQNVRPWLHEPGWSLYVAMIGDAPAAASILFVHDGTGYLADSTTDPAYRGRGLHAALLRRRLRDASVAGVDFICSGADFLSTSHRNMERAGMRLLFLRAMWTQPA